MQVGLACITTCLPRWRLSRGGQWRGGPIRTNLSCGGCVTIILLAGGAQKIRPRRAELTQTLGPTGWATRGPRPRDAPTTIETSQAPVTGVSNAIPTAATRMSFCLDMIISFLPALASSALSSRFSQYCTTRFWLQVDDLILIISFGPASVLLSTSLRHAVTGKVTFFLRTVRREYPGAEARRDSERALCPGRIT